MLVADTTGSSVWTCGFDLLAVSGRTKVPKHVRRTIRPGKLLLQEGEHLVGLSTVDVALRKKLELLVGAVELARELEDLRDWFRLLSSELVAGKREDLESLRVVLVVKIDKRALCGASEGVDVGWGGG